MKSRLFIFLIVLILAYLGSAFMIRKLIYFPGPAPTIDELTDLKSLDFHPFEGAPGTHDFRGYLRAPRAPKRLVLIFHGNAGSAADRVYMTLGLSRQEDVVFLAEYPGYGGRKGNPSEEKIFKAALEDAKLLQKKFPHLPVMLIGESLGTGVASWLSQQMKTQSLVLVSPFTSLVDVGKVHYPFLPVKQLLPDRFDSSKHLQNSQIPLLVIHGDRDDIIPYALGQQLYEAYPGPKRLVTLKGFAHNDLPWMSPQGELRKAITNSR